MKIQNQCTKLHVCKQNNNTSCADSLFYTIRYRIYTYDIEINQYLLIEKGLERHAQNIARRTDSYIRALSLIHIMARLFD